MVKMHIKDEIEEFPEQCDDTHDEDYVPSSTEGRAKPKKPKVILKWTDNDVFKLIACVQEHPTLWDPRDSQYRNKNVRTRLWRQIAEKGFKSKFPSGEVLAKWSNIRIQFRSYENKKTKCGDSASAPKIHWKFFKPMQFIGQADCETAANANVIEPNLVLTEDTENSPSSPVHIPTSNMMYSTANRSRKRQFNDELTSTVQNPHSAAATIVAESMKAAVETLNQTKQQTCVCGITQFDEFDAFGKYLASELRSMDDIVVARRIKRQINRLFLDAMDGEQNVD